MVIRNKLTIFILAMVLSAVSVRAIWARNPIYDILAKGSIWSLNVDGESGTLKLLGGKGNRVKNGDWIMTMEVTWQGNPGKLKADADGKNIEQHVIIDVQRRNGLRVKCEGFIALEASNFMGGTTYHAAKPRDHRGVWVATRIRKMTGPNGRVLGARISPRKPPAGNLSLSPSKNEATAFKPPERDSVPAIKPGSKVPKVVDARGSISGKIYGSGMTAAKIFWVVIYGPNDFKRYRGGSRFDDNGGYSFTGLADGKYKVVVGTRADTLVGPHPSFRIVECKGIPVNNVNFELK